MEFKGLRQFKVMYEANGEYFYFTAWAKNRSDAKTAGSALGRVFSVTDLDTGLGTSGCEHEKDTKHLRNFSGRGWSGEEVLDGVNEALKEAGTNYRFTMDAA